MHLYSVCTCYTFWIFTRRYRYLTWKLRGSNRFFILYRMEPHSTDSHLIWTVLVVPTKNLIIYLLLFYPTADPTSHTLMQSYLFYRNRSFLHWRLYFYYYFPTKLYMLLPTCLQWTLLCSSSQWTIHTFTLIIFNLSTTTNFSTMASLPKMATATNAHPSDQSWAS